MVRTPARHLAQSHRVAPMTNYSLNNNPLPSMINSTLRAQPMFQPQLCRVSPPHSRGIRGKLDSQALRSG